MSLIPEEIISQVLDRCQIAEVISSYIPLKKAGRNFKALCPFHHEKSPSFLVNPDKQIFHCFGCGVGGNVISFIMQQERLDFPEAVRLLAQKVGIAIPTREFPSGQTSSIKPQIYKINELAATYFNNNLLTAQSVDSQKARQYLKGRRVNLEMVKSFRLGFALDEWDRLLNFLKSKNVPLTLMEKAGLIVVKENREGFYDRFRNRITFPIFDVKMQCVGFGARTIQEAEGAKYINSPETVVYTKGQHLYGLPWAKDGIIRRDSVIVVEGYMDFLMTFQAGIDNIVASLGTALTTEQVRLLRRYTQNIVMLFDGDTAGESAMARSLDLLIEEGMNVKVAILPKGEDPDSFISKSGFPAFQERVLNSQSLFDFKLNHLMNKFDSKSIEGRAKIADEMLSTIDRFAHEVLRFGYVKRLAENLSVSEEALHKELNRKATHAGKTNVRGVQQTVLIKSLRAVESNILKLMLEQEELIPLTKEEVTIADFQDEHIRNVVTKIYELFDMGKQINLSNIMNGINDQQVLQKISGIMAAEDILVGDRKKIHRDCLERLKKDRLKSIRQDLHQQIRQAEAAGDQSRLNELKEKFNQLIKG